MWEFLGDLLGPALSWFVNWIQKGKAASDAVKASNNQAAAEAHSGALRDTTDRQVQAAREQNDEAMDHARRDGANADGLRKQSADVSAAIAQANRELR